MSKMQREAPGEGRTPESLVTAGERADLLRPDRAARARSMPLSDRD